MIRVRPRAVPGPSLGPSLGLALFLAIGLSACSPAVQPGGIGSAKVPPSSPPEDELSVPDLAQRVSSVNLTWLVKLSPQALFKHPSLGPLATRLIGDQRVESFKRQTGLDLRRVSELVGAEYHTNGRDTSALLVRHTHNASDLERHFAAGLTSTVQTSHDAHQIRRVWGFAGGEERSFVALGPHVVGYDFGSPAKRSFCRIAVLHQLKPDAKSPTLADLFKAHRLAKDTSHDLRLIAPGPFPDGALRGLLAVATLVDLRASLPKDGASDVAISLDFHGDYDDDAVPYMERAWGDVAQSDVGHLLGFTRRKAAVMRTEGKITLTVSVDIDSLTRGLLDLTTAEVDEILR